MHYDILMTVVSVDFIHEINLNKDECDEVVIRFVCKTPLNESDTCAMICRYFIEVYFDEDSDDVFIHNNNMSEMRGVIRAMPSDNSLNLTVGECVIPIDSKLVGELKTGVYHSDIDEVDAKTMVENQLGDLFDKEGNLIIHESAGRTPHETITRH